MNMPQKTLQRVVLDLFLRSLNYGVDFPHLTILTGECLSFWGVVLGLVQKDILGVERIKDYFSVLRLFPDIITIHIILCHVTCK
jgi:hypothetical protein